MSAYKVCQSANIKPSEFYDFSFCDRYWTRGGIIHPAIIFGKRVKCGCGCNKQKWFLHIVDIPMNLN